MKYVCKDLWAFLFRKPASRLQTDRRGNYIIQDACFRWLEQSTPYPTGPSDRDAELHEAALLHLALPCGVIRGALLAIGVECTVTAEVVVSALPACSFTVTLKGADEAKEAM